MDIALSSPAASPNTSTLAPAAASPPPVTALSVGFSEATITTAGENAKVTTQAEMDPRAPPLHYENAPSTPKGLAH